MAPSASRDDAESALARTVEDATRTFLGRVLDAVLAALRAGRRPDASPVVTLGTLLGWWTADVSDRVVESIQTAWSDAFTVTLDGRKVTTARAEAMAFHIAAVRDRLSRDAVPEIPEAAFEQVRLSQSAAALGGWDVPTQARDIAERLAWEPDKGYWKAQKALAEQQIDRILDPLGAPGTPARTHAHKNDPEVALWQAVRASAVDKIKEHEGDWKVRATRIARTESTGAWNAGALAALQAEGRTHKAWMATKDPRTRESHRLADGQVVPLMKQFRVGDVLLMMPGDPAAPPWETVNCRCTLVGADAPAPPVITASALVDLLTSLVASGNSWRDQLRVPKGNQNRSGRWMFTPWKHLDDLAALLNGLGSGEDTAEARARVNEALASFNGIDPNDFDPRDVTEAARHAADLLDSLPDTDDPSFNAGLIEARAGIRNFADVDWTLFAEDTDLVGAPGGRVNKNLWEGPLPSDDAVNPDLADKTSQDLVDELARIKAHPIQPSPTTRRRRAAYIKELQDRADRDALAVDKPEDTDLITPDEPEDPDWKRATEDTLWGLKAGDVEPQFQLGTQQQRDWLTLTDEQRAKANGLMRNGARASEAIRQARDVPDTPEPTPGVTVTSVSPDDAGNQIIHVTGAEPVNAVDKYGYEYLVAPEAFYRRNGQWYVRGTKAGFRRNPAGKGFLSVQNNEQVPQEVKDALSTPAVPATTVDPYHPDSPIPEGFMKARTDAAKIRLGDILPGRGLVVGVERNRTDTRVRFEDKDGLKHEVTWKNTSTVTIWFKKQGVPAAIKNLAKENPDPAEPGVSVVPPRGPKQLGEALTKRLEGVDLSDDAERAYEEALKQFDFADKADTLGVDRLQYLQRAQSAMVELAGEVDNDVGADVGVMIRLSERMTDPRRYKAYRQAVLDHTDLQADLDKAAKKDDVSSARAAAKIMIATLRSQLTTDAGAGVNEAGGHFDGMAGRYLHDMTVGLRDYDRDRWNAGLASLEDLARGTDPENPWRDTIAHLRGLDSDLLLGKPGVNPAHKHLAAELDQASASGDVKRLGDTLLSMFTLASQETTDGRGPGTNSMLLWEAMSASNAQDPERFRQAIAQFQSTLSGMFARGENVHWPETYQESLTRVSRTFVPIFRAGGERTHTSLVTRYGEIPEEDRTPHSVIEAIGVYFHARSVNNNCVLASMAYELRRRGIDAQPKAAKVGKSSNMALSTWFTANPYDPVNSLNISGLERRQAATKYNMTVEQIRNHFPSGSRGVIRADWKNVSFGHIWNWEHHEDGSVVFYDAQTGTVIEPDEHYWKEMKPGSVIVTRLDNRALKEDIEVILAPKELAAKTARHRETAREYAEIKRRSSAAFKAWMEWSNQTTRPIFGTPERAKWNEEAQRLARIHSNIVDELTVLKTSARWRELQEDGNAFPLLDGDHYRMAK